jgi:hypothetical protein
MIWLTLLTSRPSAGDVVSVFVSHDFSE